MPVVDVVVIDLLLVVGLLACIAIASVLATAEVSLLRVRRTQVVAASEGDPRARRLLALLDDLPVVLNVVLLLVLATQVSAATISAVLASRWFGGVGVPLMSMAVTGLLFVYGEALPKTRAVRDPRRNALRATPALHVVVWLFRVPVAVLSKVVRVQLPAELRQDVATEAEIRLLAKQAAASGEIEQDDVALVERSFRFGDLAIGHVMVPRPRIRQVQAGESVETAIGLALAYGHRRLPVTGTDIDDVVGVVRLRDLVAAPSETTGSTVEALMTPPLFCAPDDSLASTLSRMQSSGQWLAMVVDSTGTVGLVTIEDIVAELVGEIADER